MLIIIIIICCVFAMSPDDGPRPLRAQTTVCVWAKWLPSSYKASNMSSAFYAGCAGAPKRDPAINTPCTFAKPQTQNPKPTTINPSALQYVGKGPAQRALRICRSLELVSATSIVQNTILIWVRFDTMHDQIMSGRI